MVSAVVHGWQHDGSGLAVHGGNFGSSNIGRVFLQLWDSNRAGSSDSVLFKWLLCRA